jgi:hypothetical protein
VVEVVTNPSPSQLARYVRATSGPVKAIIANGNLIIFEGQLATHNQIVSALRLGSATEVGYIHPNGNQFASLGRGPVVTQVGAAGPAAGVSVPAPPPAPNPGAAPPRLPPARYNGPTVPSLAEANAQALAAARQRISNRAALEAVTPRAPGVPSQQSAPNIGGPIMLAFIAGDFLANRVESNPDLVVSIFGESVGMAPFHTAENPGPQLPQVVPDAARASRMAAPPANESAAALQARQRAALAADAQLLGVPLDSPRLVAPPVVPSGPSIYAQILAGTPMDVDLLTGPPATTDPATWPTPNWPGYERQPIVAVQLGQQVDQAQVRIVWPYALTDVQVSELWGIGISFAGQGVFAWPLEEGTTAGQLVIDLFISPVQTP